jgi:hypothetical protein
MTRDLVILVTLTMAVSAVAGPAVGQNGEVRAEEAAPETPTDYSLRYIPETLPLSGGARQSSDFFEEVDAESGGKELSMRRAILYSLLLPGLGDYYAGKKSRATAFFIVDAALWASFIAFQVQGHRREDDYQNFAVQFAGISSTDHTDDFYSTIGQFNSSDDYETDFKKESRPEIWPDVGYEALEEYYVGNRVADFEEWAWQSSELRIDYREMRSSSKLSYRRSGYIIAVLVANRLVASVFAYQAVKSSRKETDIQTGQYRVDFSAPPFGVPGEYAATVSVVRSF